MRRSAVFWLLAAGLPVLAVLGVVLSLKYYVPTLDDGRALPLASGNEPIVVPASPDAAPELPLATLPDLSRVDRRLIAPANLNKPRYCLLVFGPQASTRVWLIEDGDKLYVDRNANGDLTEAGETFSAADTEHFTTIDDDGKPVQQSEWTYEVGDLTPGDRSGRHTDFRVVRFQVGREPAYHIVSVRVNGGLLQYAGWAPLFAESPSAAPVIHFGGPAVPQALRGGTIHRNKRHPDVHFCIGTPGLGPNSFAYISYEALPSTLDPVVEIRWPGSSTAAERYALRGRC